MHEGRYGKGGSQRISCVIDGERKFLLQILSKVQDDGHHLVRIHEVIGVERVESALLGMSILSRVGDTMELPEAQVIRINGHLVINHLACFIAVVEGLSHEVHVLRDGLTGSLPEHKTVE
jgi:hypothetical protein